MLLIRCYCKRLYCKRLIYKENLNHWEFGHVRLYFQSKLNDEHKITLCIIDWLLYRGKLTNLYLESRLSCLVHSDMYESIIYINHNGHILFIREV